MLMVNLWHHYVPPVDICHFAICHTNQHSYTQLFVAGEGDPGGGVIPALPVRETIFSSEICSYEYDETERRQSGDHPGAAPGTILFDDIGNIQHNEILSWLLSNTSADASKRFFWNLIFQINTQSRRFKVFNISQIFCSIFCLPTCHLKLKLSTLYHLYFILHFRWHQWWSEGDLWSDRRTSSSPTARTHCVARDSTFSSTLQ